MTSGIENTLGDVQERTSVVELDVSDLTVVEEEVMDLSADMEEDDEEARDATRATPFTDIRGPYWDVFVQYGGGDKRVPQLMAHYTNGETKEDYHTIATPEIAQKYLMQASAAGEKIPRPVGMAMLDEKYMARAEMWFGKERNPEQKNRTPVEIMRDSIYKLMEPEESQPSNVVTLPVKKAKQKADVPYAVNH